MYFGMSIRNATVFFDGIVQNIDCSLAINLVLRLLSMCAAKTSKLSRYKRIVFFRVLCGSFFIKMPKESEFNPTLEVKVYEPDEDKFRNMGKYLRMIEADSENHKIGLVKVSL